MINSFESSGIVDLRLFFLPNAVFLFAENSLSCLTILLAICVESLDVA